jgi:hypothetical protein
MAFFVTDSAEARRRHSHHVHPHRLHVDPPAEPISVAPKRTVLHASPPTIVEPETITVAYNAKSLGRLCLSYLSMIERATDRVIAEQRVSLDGEAHVDPAPSPWGLLQPVIRQTQTPPQGSN